MKFRVARTAISLLLLCLVGCGSDQDAPIPPPNPPGTAPVLAREFLFVSLRESNSIAGFEIDTRTGALTQAPGSPFAAMGVRPMGLAVHPSGRFLYSANFSSPWNSDRGLGGVSAYVIGAGGALTGLGTEVTVGSGIEPFTVVVEPAGRFAYTAAALSAIPASYAIEATGAVTPLSTDFADYQNRFHAGDLVTADGFVYESFAAGIDAFAIGAGGQLTEAGLLPALQTDSGVGSMALAPGGRFIYAIQNGSQLPPSPSTQSYVISVAINSPGVLEMESRFALNGATEVAVSGQFLFALNPQGVWVFRTDANTGAFSLMNGSPFSVANDSGHLEVDASGKFLYVGTVHFDGAGGLLPSTLVGFSIDANTGELSPLPGSPYSLPGPVGGIAASAEAAD